MAGTVRHDEESGAYIADYDWSTADPSVQVVEVIAVALDREPVDVPQLYRSVDPDALDTLVAGGAADEARTAEITFVHAGCQVTVDGDGRVTVEPDAD